MARVEPVQVGLVSHAVQLDIQPLLRAEKHRGLGGVAVTVFHFDARAVFNRGAVRAVAELFLKGILPLQFLRAEHVDVQGVDPPLVVRGDLSAGKGQSAGKAHLVLERQHQLPGTGGHTVPTLLLGRHNLRLPARTQKEGGTA